MMVMYMSHQFPDELKSGESNSDLRFIFMIFVPEGDDVVDEGSDSSLSDGRALGLSANIPDDFFG
jgi:hypothetical protein